MSKNRWRPNIGSPPPEPPKPTTGQCGHQVHPTTENCSTPDCWNNSDQRHKGIER
ncbi:hypothetical protein SAMN04489729_4824 [Amycolatopsis lurida]|uniref:hypothetical protein n=1 Tax=Amycolatopsis lurida TaxID=31959 RepID=UPI00089AB841|nr:hypothetical protein [Amycolatopsis lurida]SED60871.1 hypothetical protein SAMN04489729_4824 [Amycolatopsis lurida]